MSWKNHIGRPNLKREVCIREDLLIELSKQVTAGDVDPKLAQQVQECTVTLVLRPCDAEAEAQLRSEMAVMVGASRTTDASPDIIGWMKRCITAQFVGLEQAGEDCECDADDLAMILDALTYAQLEALTEGMAGSWEAVDPKAVLALAVAKPAPRSKPGSNRRSSRVRRSTGTDAPTAP